VTVTREAVAGLAALVLVVAALGLWLAERNRATTASPALGPSTTRPARTAAPLGPDELSAAGLKARAGALGQDVYWLGPEKGGRYELERTAAGDVFVRYPTAWAGGSHGVTTVGTYPLPDAYAATGALARRDGWAEEHVEAWLVAYPSSAPGTGVYLAAQSFPYQIEVYDPEPGRARSLVESGAVGPVR
jgi:hypothetical protein